MRSISKHAYALAITFAILLATLTPGMDNSALANSAHGHRGRRAVKSSSRAGTPALARWAAICAPIVPAPRTAAEWIERDIDLILVQGAWCWVLGAVQGAWCWCRVLAEGRGLRPMTDS